jgi:hypothetical protein
MRNANQTLTDVTDLSVTPDAAPTQYSDTAPVDVLRTEVARLTDALTAQRAAMDVLLAELQSRVTERDVLRLEVERLREQLAVLEAERRVNQRY